MGKGLLIVNTGNGKGKTTAALGLALRALGHGLPVSIIQFIKGTWKYGELFSVKRFEDLLDFHVMGKGFVWKAENAHRHNKAAQDAWALAKKSLKAKKYRVVVLDELTYCMHYGFIPEAEVVDVLCRRRKDLHVVVTGRDAPKTLIDAADLVTEMREIKHPFQNGIKGQKGIEF